MDFIGVSNLFSLNNTKTNFNINKFSNNPIAFRGCESDSFEHSCSDYEKNKERVKRSVDLEIQEYYSKIASENKNIKKIDETKEKLYFIAGNSDFSALAKPFIDKYYESLEYNRQELKKLEETSKELQEFLTLKSVLSDENHFDKLTKIIIEYRPKYLEKFAKKRPSYSQLLRIATSISKNIDEEIWLKKKNEFRNLNSLLKRQINECTRKYCENNAIDLTDKDINRFAACYVDALESGFDSFKEGIEHAYRNDYTPFNSNINMYNFYIRSLKKDFENYLEVLKKSPYKAPWFDPSLSKDEKIEALRCDEDNFGYFQDSEFSDSFSRFKKCGILEEFEHIPYLYDLNIEQNKRAIDYILANNGVITTRSELFSKYHLPVGYFESLPIKTEAFICWNYEKVRSSTFVDMSDDKTRRIVEQEMQKLERITPKESKYCYGGFFTQDQEEIPAARLEKMGFGNLNLLYKLVKNGELKGRLEKTQTPEAEKIAVYVNLQDCKTPKILNKIRDNTPVSNFSQFAKELGLTQKQLFQYALDGEVDVIGRYLFKIDSTTRYFDKRTPKNKAFIERILFENKLKEQLKKEQIESDKQRKIERMDALSKFQSFKMSLVWHFCPKTREIASNMAKSDGYLCSLLVKDAQKEEELTKKEEAKVNSYRKQLWNTVGSDELKEGFKKANEILNLYSSKGIDAIEDDEIRTIFKQYGYCD